jgi:hypothetical protein
LLLSLEKGNEIGFKVEDGWRSLEPNMSSTKNGEYSHQHVWPFKKRRRVDLRVENKPYVEYIEEDVDDGDEDEEEAEEKEEETGELYEDSGDDSSDEENFEDGLQDDESKTAINAYKNIKIFMTGDKDTLEYGNEQVKIVTRFCNPAKLGLQSRAMSKKKLTAIFDDRKHDAIGMKGVCRLDLGPMDWETLRQELSKDVRYVDLLLSKVEEVYK